MGEYSKAIGHYGEQIVKTFLEEIGYRNPVKGIDIKCYFGENHKLKENSQRSSHGIDYVYSYKCPFIDGVLKNVLISVKFSKKGYKNSPIREFKEYFEDLAFAIECFHHSETKGEIAKGFSHYDTIEDLGIIIWLNDDPESYDDLINQLYTARIDSDYKITAIYVLDNKRLVFIHRCIEYLKINFNEFNSNFFYINTGKNVNPLTKINSGNFLPIEYINSSIIPIKLQRKDREKEVILILFCLDNFEPDEFKKVLGISKDLSTGLTSKIIIGYPNYNEIDHLNTINIVKQQFEDSNFTSDCIVINYNDKFPTAKQF